ncbi:MAG: DUF167 domain-containing protein [Chloroflexi bacterium]|nr:DUF167 domain-containing protein [Chloroflexota bacterium]
MNQDSASLEIKVITGAKQSEICEFLDDGSLKLKIHAKPVDGKANQELVEFLSRELGISRTEIVFIRGEHSKRKVLRFIGISQADLQSRLLKLTSF